MAKLSQKRARRLSFLAHKLALATGADERMALLAELLDELGIDQEQRADSLESAERHLRYEAAQRRKAAATDDIDNMKRDELRRCIDDHAWPAVRLLAERRAEQEPAPTPDPAPIVTEADVYTVTAKQRRRLAAFDDMTDADQVDTLQAMWGEA